MTKGPLLTKRWNALSNARKAEIKSRAAALRADYLTLQELRKEAGLTQAGVSERLAMPQSNVSRLEKNSDMLLSTLRTYIEAIGGKLQLTVEFPGRAPIALTGLGDLVDDDGRKSEHQG